MPVVGTAIHNGHELRPDLARRMALDPDVRMREEDPFTATFIDNFPRRVVVYRSRFEVDLNRPRAEAVYATPDDAWGLELWSEELSKEQVEESRRLHDTFYVDLESMLDRVVDMHGGFVLYDVHSYNHRRPGPGAPPEDPEENPMINLGTGTMPEKWHGVADAFLRAITDSDALGEPIDARENVKFEGRRMAEFVHERYGTSSCALAIEFRKDFMDEWTGELYPQRQKALTRALDDTIDPVVARWRSIRAGQ